MKTALLASGLGGALETVVIVFILFLCLLCLFAVAVIVRDIIYEIANMRRERKKDDLSLSVENERKNDGDFEQEPQESSMNLERGRDESTNK